MKDALWLDRFIEVYSSLSPSNLHTLREVYHANVEFSDPMHRVEGLQALLMYFDNIYTQVTHCDFVIEHVFRSESEAAVYWKMTFIHNKLNGKQPITVQGHSHIKAQDDLVIFHRDYLDLGAMLYEHLPLIGSLVKTIKQRASTS